MKEISFEVINYGGPMPDLFGEIGVKYNSDYGLWIFYVKEASKRASLIIREASKEPSNT